MDKSVDDPDKRPVPRYSLDDENVIKCYLNGALDSNDFDDDFKLNIRPSGTRATMLPYERQRLEFRPALAPLVGSPAAAAEAPAPPKCSPPAPPAAPPAPSAEVVARVLGAEIKALEAVIAAQAITIAKRDIEIVRVRTTKRLLENVVGSFCAYYRHVNAHLFK